MTVERYRTGASIRIYSEQQINRAGTPLTALADVLLLIRRESDNFYFDFDDNTFKAAAHVDIDRTMTVVNATNDPGIYETTWNTSLIVSPVAGDKYLLGIASATAVNLRANGVALLGDWVDAVHQMQIQLIDHNVGSVDRYTAVFFRDTEPMTTGITGTPTIQVIDASDGSNRIPATAMTEIPTGSGRWRYDAVTTQRVISGTHYIAVVSATLDGLTKTWHRGIGRDST
jgi:hypothetical protein